MACGTRFPAASRQRCPPLYYKGKAGSLVTTRITPTQCVRGALNPERQRVTQHQAVSGQGSGRIEGVKGDQGGSRGILSCLVRNTGILIYGQFLSIALLRRPANRDTGFTTSLSYVHSEMNSRIAGAEKGRRFPRAPESRQPCRARSGDQQAGTFPPATCQSACVAPQSSE